MIRLPGHTIARGSRRGVTLILVVLALPVLVGLLTLAIDLGWAYLQEARLRDAGIAAATAAGNKIAAGATAADARTAAKAFALANGIALDDADITFDPNGSNPNCIRISRTRRVSLFWGPLLGWNGLDTRFDLYALAMSDLTQLHDAPPPPNASSGIVPLGVPHADLLPVLTGQAATVDTIAPLIFRSGQQFVHGKHYLLKTGSSFKMPLPGVSQGSSNEGGLDLGGRGSGASKFRMQLLTGVGSPVMIGDLVATQPGNMAGPTMDGINARCAADTSSTADSFKPFSARVVLVPIVRTAGQAGADDLGTGVPGLKNILYMFEGGQIVEVIGMARFLVDPYIGELGPGAVTGQFIEYVGKPPNGQGPG